MLIAFLKKQRERFRYYDAITGMSKILRRYFVMNSFDGALTTFGLLLGSFISGVEEPQLVLGIGIATAIAIGFSGLAGALMTETAERRREIHTMEKALHRKLDRTDYKRAYESASMLAGVVDGISPLIASLVLLSPFFFLDVLTAYYTSFGFSLALFFSLGMFLGKISRESILMTGLKFLGVALLCMAVIILLRAF